MAFRVLASDNFPAHRTIADFRPRHLPEFQALFVQLVQVAREVGLVKLGTVAVDGSKVKASASKHRAMSYGRMKQEEKRVRQEIQYLAEPPFAWIKSLLGFDRFSVRGRTKVANEWTLACFAANLRRLHGKLEWV